jgi:membrane-bound lytic murein transglycosylase D
MRKMSIALLSVIFIMFPYQVNALEIPDNPRIDHWVNDFINGKRKFFQASVIRSGLYRPSIIKVFRKEGIPEDLSWLPLIESGFDCSAKSKAKAAGCWQFMSRTGKEWGLGKGNWKDHRYDFNKSTVAAAKYLKRLHRSFKDWNLALAAYNVGYGNVRKAIKKAGSKNYWYLKLPEETMNYVPQFYATLKITGNLKEYGFNESENSLVIVMLAPGSHNLRYIANKILRVDYDDFRRLNPGYEIGYTPPGESAMIYLREDWNVAMLRGFGVVK